MTTSEFEELFKKYFLSLCNIAYAIVKDQDQAKDIVQQVFIKFWDKKNSVNIEDNIHAYLKKAVVNTAINHLEKNKRLQLADDFQNFNIENRDNEAKEQTIETLHKAIKNAIANLPEKCQTVFSLSKYEGMTNQEIANYMEISIKAVEKHKTRALKELRITLKPYLNILSIILFVEVGFCLFNLFY